MERWLSSRHASDPSVVAGFPVSGTETVLLPIDDRNLLLHIIQLLTQ